MVSQVTSVSARLEAQINPHGALTEFRFEYGRSTSYEASVPVPDGDAGAGMGDELEGVLVEGLAPGTTYHYRAVLHGSGGVVNGSDGVFTTQAGGGSGLLDGRVWEMVSPPDKHGVSLESLNVDGGVIQAAEDGGELAYIAKGPIDTEPQGNRSIAVAQLLATRVSGAWSSQDISTPHEEVAGLIAGHLSEYQLFSSDLSAGLVEPEGATPLSPAASERTPYRREADGEYVPLVTGCPALGEPCPASVKEHENVPPGTSFGEAVIEGQFQPQTGVYSVAATPDLRHVVLGARQSLKAGFETGGFPALYEWSGGTLQPVSVLPDGASAAVEEGASLGAAGIDLRNAVSADGSRVFFETLHSPQDLFVRDVARGESVQLDVAEEGAAGGTHNDEPRFQDASSDGGKVFFTDETRLTRDATSTPSEPDLYMCDVAAVSVGERDCSHHLRDLTVDVHPGEAADVLGAVLGAGETGERIYFVANGVLTEGQGATHGECRAEETLASPAQLCNLYAYNTVTGETRLVAVLSNSDFTDFDGGEGHARLSQMSARVSGTGRFLAFMSQRSLTGFDNLDAVSGVPDEEVFLFDAVSGRLVCASCNPTGARPVGVFDPTSPLSPGLLVDRPKLWIGQTLAGSVPGWTRFGRELALYQSRYLDDSGRLFFDSPVGLVGGDGNGVEDVYEYEPEGAGPGTARCGPASGDGSEVFKPARSVEVEGRVVEEGAGCVGLISSGASGEESAFLDAGGMGPGGEEGEGVFFLTAGRLSSLDVDSALDVYDARVCSLAVPCPATGLSVPGACTTADGCRAGFAPQPAIFGAPSSATVSGAGNVPPAAVQKKTPAEVRAERLAAALRACRTKRNKHERRVCEASARSRYGAVKAGRKSVVKKSVRRGGRGG